MFQLTHTCTITNNGPVAANVTDTATLGTLPGDCTTSSLVTQSANFTLNPVAPGNSTASSFVWNITCTNPSNHTFTASNSVAVTGPLHVRDPNAGNNTGSGTVVVAITTQCDPNVSGVDTVSSNGGPNTGQTFTVTVSATVALACATGGTTTISLSGPADCTLTPTGGQSQPTVSGIQSATWSVVCTAASNHSFAGTVSIAPTFPEHVSDSNTANNSGSDATPVVVPITAIGVLVVTISGVPAVIDVSSTATGATINATVKVENNGATLNNVTWTGTIAGSGLIPCAGSTPINGSAPTIPPTQTNIYAGALTIPSGHECEFTVQVCATGQGTIHQVGQDCDSVTGLIQRDVLVVKMCLLVGPAAVNLSDTNGRYMWVICEIGNLNTAAELVHISMTIAEAVPAGCTRTQALVLPGADQFLMAGPEQKTVVWRVRYECHSPATAQVINQTVTVGITHCDPTTTLPDPQTNPTPGGPCTANSQNEGPAGVETNISNNTKTTTKQVIIQ
jgi:hypothetical protein